MFSNVPGWLVYTIGFGSQLFFGLRTGLQWILSEKAKKVVSPSSYWIFSLLGAYLMFVYGVLRNDFSIIFGQIITSYVYLWNLRAKGIWQGIRPVFKAVLLLIPVVAVLLLLRDAGAFFRNFLSNEQIPLFLVVFGSCGQLLFTLRFVYQWYYSWRHGGVSVLPTGFWIMGICGSAIIVIYAIIRRDPVLMLGQTLSLAIYSRNLMLCYKK